MKVKTPTDTKFKNYHSKLLKHLRLKGLQPKTIDAYELGACPRIGIVVKESWI